MILKPSSKVYLAPSRIANAGRGVFASHRLRAGDLIERCPVVLLSEAEIAHLRETKLLNYYFQWGDDPRHHRAGICLGFGSLYNHSYQPNAAYKKLLDEEIIEFIAIKDIQLNEEITVNYNHGNPDDKSKLWVSDIPQESS